jgi:hypothetical protein
MPWLRNPTILSLTALGKERDQLLKTLHGFTAEVSQYFMMKLQSSHFLDSIFSSSLKVINNRRETLKKKEYNVDQDTRTGIST